MVGSCSKPMVACPCIVACVAASHPPHLAAVKRIPLSIQTDPVIAITETCLCLWCHQQALLSLPPAHRPVISSSSPALAARRPGRTLIKVWEDPHGPGTASRTAAPGRPARALSRFRAMPQHRGQAARSQSSQLNGLGAAAVLVGNFAKAGLFVLYCGTCTIAQPTQLATKG